MEQTAIPSPNDWSPRKVALATLTVLAIAAAFWIFFRFRLVFFSLFTAIVLSTAIEPVVRRLIRWGIPRPISIILFNLAILAAVIVLVMTVVPLLVDQWATITSLLSGWYSDLRGALVDSTSLIVRRIALQLPALMPMSLPAPRLEGAVEENSLDLVQQAFDISTAVLRSLLIVLAVGLLTSFWVLEGERATRVILMGVPLPARETIRTFIEEVEEKVGAYTRGLVLLSLIIGTLALVAYLIIGLPSVLFLAFFAGIMEAVPLIGPLLGAVPAVLLALSTDPTKVIWVVIATVIIQMLENNLIVPRVMDRAVGVNPVVSLLAFIAFGSMFGLVGALLAIPLAAVIQIILQRYVFKPNLAEQPLMRRDAVSILRYEAQDLVQDVRKQVRDKDSELTERADQVEDAIEAIVQDLDSILAQVELSANEIEAGQGDNGGREQ